MKRVLVIALGIGMLATAGATAVSTPDDASAAAKLGKRSQLTTEQLKSLQARYRYWSSSQTMTLKTPI